MNKAFKVVYKLGSFIILKQVSRNNPETNRINNNEEIQIQQDIDGIAYAITFKKKELIEILNKEVKM